MKTLSKILATLTLTAASFFGSGCIKPEQDISSNIQKIIPSSTSKFSAKEESLIGKASRTLSKRYTLDYDITVLKLKPEIEKQGCAFPKLGFDEDEKKFFIETFGQENYNKLEGKDVVAIQGLDFYEYAVRNRKVWGSRYIRRLSLRDVYINDVLHETIHTIFERVATPEIVDKISEIDVKSKVYEANLDLGEIVRMIAPDGVTVSETLYRRGERPTHPGHPSFYSFLYACAPSENDDTDTKKKFVSEQFAEILSYYLRGVIHENIKDKNLAEKIKIVKDSLKPYEKR